MEYGGSDCSRKYRTLEEGENHLAVTANGMSFYTFNLTHGNSFRIICTGLGPSSSSDPDYYLSYESLPSLGEYLDAVMDYGDAANFVRNQEQGGVWVLGLYARCCADVEVLVVLEVREEPFASPQLSPCTFPCDCQRYTQSEGQLEDGSGLYGYDYANCRWIISPAAVGPLRVSFPAFALASGDFVQLNECLDGLCDSSVALATLTGSVSSSSSFLAASGTLEVVFSSNSAGLADGFLLKWISLGAFDVCEPQCNCGIFNGTHGVLTDGGGGTASAVGLYPNNAFCHWVLFAPQASWLQVSFKRFATEFSHDLLQAKECDDIACRSSRAIGAFSGSIENLVLLSTTGIMNLVFTSDASGQDRGFEAVWTSSLLAESGYLPSPSLPGRCGSGYRCQECSSPCHCQVFSSWEGVVTDGSGNHALYENLASCRWLLAPLNAANISLRFNFFETEPGYDFVSFFSCSNSSCLDRTALKNFSGSWTGHEWTVNAGVLEIVFDTDTTVRFPGFELAYRAVANPRTSSAFPCPLRFRNCSLTLSWQDLVPAIRSGRAETGGLGHLIIPGVYETWLCWLDHPCSETKPDGSTDPFCFIYSEQEMRFEPWNLNSAIGMF
uniref:CUB domain-containing protein n=1 Tax=Hanusia phi TaxID=3032 RepID=A0A7S0NG18_9CRYP